MVKVQQSVFSQSGGFHISEDSDDVTSPQLVLFFAARELLDTPHYFELLRDSYPGASIVGCSTAGEIVGAAVHDHTAVACALQFQSTDVRTAVKTINPNLTSYDVGLALGAELGRPDLRCILVFSDGLAVNGSDLIRGLTRGAGDDVVIAGGLAGDGDRFHQTLVSCDAHARSDVIAAIGFYGDALSVSHASTAGCEAFGPSRTITRSTSNILYEIDGYPVLELYCRYLGDEAANLPASAQFLPLLIQPPDRLEPGYIRTPIGMDEAAGSLIYAGDVPEGYCARLARAGCEELVRGAAEAAEVSCRDAVPGRKFALIVSCIGRKMVLGNKVNDETSAVCAAYGTGVISAGFYSYGEIGASPGQSVSHLHNQTMTVTTLTEA